MEAIIAALVGAIVGAGLAALFGIWQASKLHKMEHQSRVQGLIQALEGELAVISELADVDLDLNNIQSHDQGLERVHRVAIARDVFESAAGDLGILPDGLPSGVVRCYGRLAAKTEAMSHLLRNPDFSTMKGDGPKSPGMRKRYEEHRELISTEAGALLEELRKARAD